MKETIYSSRKKKNPLGTAPPHENVYTSPDTSSTQRIDCKRVRKDSYPVELSIVHLRDALHQLTEARDVIGSLHLSCHEQGISRTQIKLRLSAFAQVLLRRARDHSIQKIRGNKPHQTRSRQLEPQEDWSNTRQSELQAALAQCG